MSDKSAIEWTDATWNPIRGCSRVSEGCRHCYAERVAARFSGRGMPYEGLARMSDGGEPRWTGNIRFIEKHLADPLRWRRPRRVFVNSMSDLFHEHLADNDIDAIFAVMALAPHHTFQVLTKRPQRMLDYMRGRDWGHAANWVFNRHLRRLDEPLYLDGEIVPPLPNVWLGVSVENQETADQRIPLLLQTPAAVRFISAEPLLGAIEFQREWWPSDRPTRLDWIIVGGESGPGARPMHPTWARSIRDQCAGAGVAFFFKQWGEWEPVAPVYGETEQDEERIERATESRCEFVDRLGQRWPESQPPAGSWCMERVGKKCAGRELDGRTWDQMPVQEPRRKL